MIKIFFKKRKNYYGAESINWYVAEKKDNECVIVYTYNFCSLDKCKNINGFLVPIKELRPYRFDFCTDVDIANVDKFVMKSSFYNHETIGELKLPINDTNLVVPDRYYGEEVLFEEHFDDCITDELKEKISKVNFNFPNILCKYVYDDFNQQNVNDSSDIRGMFFCTKCKKIYTPIRNSNDNRVNICPHCKKVFNLYNTTLILDDFNDYYQKTFANKIYNRDKVKTTEKFFIMIKKNNGIIVYKISREIFSKKSVIYINYSIDYSVEHIIGESIVAYKHLKRGKRICDSFEAFNINTKNICEVPVIIYEGADSFFEFATNNEKFLRMSGFQSVLKYSKGIDNLEAFFIVFLAILNKYPVLEQIIKMGYAKLFFDLYNSMLICEIDILPRLRTPC